MTMKTLETTYAGLKLKNPIIVSSSSLTDSAEKNKKLCEAGAVSESSIADGDETIGKGD